MFSHANEKSVLIFRSKKDWPTRCEKFHRDRLGRSRENGNLIPFSHAFYTLSGLMFQPNIYVLFPVLGIKSTVVNNWRIWRVKID